MNYFEVNNKPLDESQIKAITNSSTNNLIIASAGSGKTTTIIGKVKYLLLKENYKSEDLLILSFTRNTAKEMKERIFNETKEDIDIMTFHKLGLEIVKNNIKDANILEYNYSILKDIIIVLLKEEEFKNNFLRFMYNIKNDKKLEICKDLFISELYLIFDFLELVSNFINLMKQNNFSIDDLREKSSKKRWTLFLTLLIPIYNEYQNVLRTNNLLDFNDMINLATNLITTNTVKVNYKYLIVDEYQDISRSRYKLLKSIKDQNSSNLFCVGDDFQCIFSFAGSNLDYFVNFDKYFGEYEKNVINTTYRFNQNIANISGKFITKNPYQIKKVIKSNLKDNNSLKIISNSDITKYLSALPYHSTVLFLGRYNSDLELIKDFYIDYKNSEIIYDKRIDLRMKFMTIHESKGLEADYVIVLNNTNLKKGFPSHIENNEIIDVISTRGEKYPYAEERRLFYVAITRGKKETCLIEVKNHHSIFLKEIKKLL